MDKYLFFDIECCDGHHICSFGYVITDEKLNVLEQKDIIVNPQKSFGICRSGFDARQELAYPQEAYDNAKPFNQHYNTIIKLFKDATMIFAHSAHSDFVYFINACKRYDMPLIDVDFYDTQLLFQSMYPQCKTSLKNIAEELGVEMAGTSHKSDDDANMARLILQKLCGKVNKTARQVFVSNNLVKGQVRQDVIYKYTFQRVNYRKEKEVAFEDKQPPNTPFAELLKGLDFDDKKSSKCGSGK